MVVALGLDTKLRSLVEYANRQHRAKFGSKWARMARKIGWAASISYSPSKLNFHPFYVAISWAKIRQWSYFDFAN